MRQGLAGRFEEVLGEVSLGRFLVSHFRGEGAKANAVLTGETASESDSAYDRADDTIGASGGTVRLDQQGNRRTVADLLAGFGGVRQWFHNELTFLEDYEDEQEDGLQVAERVGSVRLYPGGLSTDEPVETADGPFVVIVDGDLTTPGYVRFGTDDYVPGLVIITGDLRAGTLWFEFGARVVVEGSAVITRACFGRWGDSNALLAVDGELHASLLVLDGYTPVHARGGIRSLIYGSLGWWKTLKPDILIEAGGHDRYFRPDLLKNGALDLALAFAADRAGSPLLLPGVEESFPERLKVRGQ